MEKGHGQVDMELKKEEVKAREKAVILYIRQDVEWQQNTNCPGIFPLVRSILHAHMLTHTHAHTHTVDICPSRKGSRV